ncbi:WAT1-related protein At5g40230-like [Cornus florida]|uniref:WAT1-related protein At5g40230-like n=1 Tax=Cornus florida TaxID=4283 RepID=UPI0028A11F9E|nr:WAT1-related protein At5g40230-like [Cornus florida]
MARGRRFCYREVLPFTLMVMVECANVGSSTLYKAATLKGMSYCVFIVYSYAVSALVLIPLAFFFHRKTALPPFDKFLVGRICLLGVLGFTCQMLGYKGIEYASPTLGSAMSNLTPACTFILAIIFRMERLEVRSPSTVAKIIGTIVLISGAFVVILYTGPAIVTETISQSISLNHILKLLRSNWSIGGLLLAIDYVILAVWYIIQAQTVKKYPAEFILVFLYNLCITVISTPVCLIIEPNLSAWKIKADVALLSILYTGIVGSAFGTVVHTWSLKTKGPVYVALFRPLSIAIAAVMGVIFLGEALYLGSVVGAIIIAVGFYVVMWGKANEEMSEDFGVDSVESLPTSTAPLLQDYISEEK